MKVRVFTMGFGEAGFDDAALQAFFAEHDAFDATEHYFRQDGRVWLTLVVRYREGASSGQPGRASAPAKEPELEPEARALYELLRRWRNERARKEARPAYVLFSNAQLAEIARRRPVTVETLTAVSGIGEGRVREYGAEILALVRDAGG